MWAPAGHGRSAATVWRDPECRRSAAHRVERRGMPAQKALRALRRRVRHHVDEDQRGDDRLHLGDLQAHAERQARQETPRPRSHRPPGRRAWPSHRRPTPARQSRCRWCCHRGRANRRRSRRIPPPGGARRPVSTPGGLPHRRAATGSVATSIPGAAQRAVRPMHADLGHRWSKRSSSQRFSPGCTPIGRRGHAAAWRLPHSPIPIGDFVDDAPHSHQVLDGGLTPSAATTACATSLISPRRRASSS